MPKIVDDLYCRFREYEAKLGSRTWRRNLAKTTPTKDPGKPLHEEDDAGEDKEQEQDRTAMGLKEGEECIHGGRIIQSYSKKVSKLAVSNTAPLPPGPGDALRRSILNQQTMA